MEKPSLLPVGARRFNNLLTERNELEAKVKKLADELDRISIKLKEREDAIKTLNNSLNNKDYEMKGHAQYIKDLENDFKKVKKSYDELREKYNKDNKELSETITDLREENAKLQSGIERHKMNLNTLMRRLDAAIEEGCFVMASNALYRHKTAEERKALYTVHVEQRFKDICKARKSQQLRSNGRYTKKKNDEETKEQ